MSEVLSRMWNRNSVNPQMNMTPGARRPRLSAKNGRKHLNMRNVERDKTPNFQIRVGIDLIASFCVLWVGLGTEFFWVQLWPGSEYVKSFTQFLNLLNLWNLWNLRLKATELAQGALSRRILSWQFLQILRMGWNQTMEEYGNNVSVLWPALFPWRFLVFLWGSWESLASISADQKMRTEILQLFCFSLFVYSYPYLHVQNLARLVLSGSLGWADHHSSKAWLLDLHNGDSSLCRFICSMHIFCISSDSMIYNIWSCFYIQRTLNHKPYNIYFHDSGSGEGATKIFKHANTRGIEWHVQTWNSFFVALRIQKHRQGDFGGDWSKSMVLV